MQNTDAIFVVGVAVSLHVTFQLKSFGQFVCVTGLGKIVKPRLLALFNFPIHFLKDIAFGIITLN